MASSGDHSDSSSEYFSPMQSPSVSATPQSPAAPATPAAAADAVAPQSHVAATASTPAAAATGAEMPVAAAPTEPVSVVTLLVTVLGAILTVYVASGHPRRGIRYSAFGVTALLSLTLVIIVVGGWIGRPEVIRGGRNLAWVVVAGAIVFALFVYST